MGKRKYKRGFQYFSVIVPTHYDDSLTSNGQQPEPRVEKPSDDPCEPPTELEPSNNSYLRFGDTPTTQDMKGKEEPGFELRSLLEGTPAWSSRLYQGFAPNENALRVGAGDAIEFNGGLESNFYKNVGWVDHSNGHRVTTTHGDKVEVITGNYKLVVLGREGNPEGSTGFDMSGGHTVNWAKTPGCVRTITAEGNSFKVTHVTDKGHEYTVFDGYDTDHIVGGSTSISVMCGKSELTAYASEAEKESAPILPMTLVVDQAWSNTIVDGDYGTTIVDIDAGEPKEKESWAFSETNDLKTNAGDLSQYPDNFGEVDAFPAASRVIEARRAEQYDEWVSVDGTFTEKVHAGQFDFTLNCVAKGGTGAFSEHISAITMDNKVNVSGTVT